jgi:NDP-sugar pyrophosphorylase family protein
MIDQNKKSGDDFEKYIVKKFDRQYFKIKNWAGDKYVEGRYAETTPQPDLLMEFHLKGESYPFAVECKWRKNDRNESFEFASETQLERYRKFESEKKIPVFVVIGLGGEAAEPEHLYIIPLKRLKYNFITLEYLEQFKKNMETEFFFDKKTGDLN